MSSLTRFVMAAMLLAGVMVAQLAFAGGGPVVPPPPKGGQGQYQQGPVIPMGQIAPQGVIVPGVAAIVLGGQQIDGEIALPKGHSFAVVVTENAAAGFRWVYGNKPRDSILQLSSTLDTRYNPPVRVMTFCPVRTGLLRLTLCERTLGSIPVIGPMHTLVVRSY